MKITKLGHCCLLIEEQPPKAAPFGKGDKVVRIMTDPGAWSTRQNEVKGVDYIFITHEHPDHFHIASLRTVLANNPAAKVITNRGVGKLLDAEHIPYSVLEHGHAEDFSGVIVEGHGEKHATIYQNFGQVVNTGYFFASRFFYPGDAFYLPAASPARLPVHGTQTGADSAGGSAAQAGNPYKQVEILALPVAGPWMKISDAIDYAKTLKPRVVFPVHDGMLKFGGPFHLVPQKFLPPAGIQFEIIAEGETKEF